MQTIDATNQKIGRIATKVASLLMGKGKTTFVRNKMVGDKVKIVNASKLSITEKKKTEKTYSRYSGYPGGLKKEKLADQTSKKGNAEALKHAISGMLPKNTLREKFLLNLEISE